MEVEPSRIVVVGAAKRFRQSVRTLGNRKDMDMVAHEAIAGDAYGVA